MNIVDPTTWLLALPVYVVGAVGAAVFGDAGVVLDVLAGGGLGAIVAQLVILKRARQEVRGREPEIVGAWTGLGALIALAINLGVEVL